MNAFAGFVVSVDMRNSADSGVYTVADNSVAVVLACNVSKTAFYVDNRLISTAVTVFKLFSLCAICKSHELMTEIPKIGIPSF